MATNRSAVQDKPQTAFEEKVLNDGELIELLEAWAKASKQADALIKRKAGASQAAKAHVEGLHLEPDTYRVGRFKVTISEHPARPVSFEVKAGTTIRFLVIGED